jgi:hypothetical protein
VNSALGNHRQITIIVRLVVDHLGRLNHGQVVDLSGTSLGRFNRWQQLTPLVQAAIPRDRSGRPPASPGPAEPEGLDDA